MPGRTKNLTVHSGEPAGSLRFEQNSWINFTVLDVGADYKVKRIEVLPLKQLNFQNGKIYAKHWTVVQGTAKVTIDDRTFSVRAGETIDFEGAELHCVENPDNSELLVFIDVQCGLPDLDEDRLKIPTNYGRIAQIASFSLILNELLTFSI